MSGHGELRHEQCRYGSLTEAYHIDERGRETPFSSPLCNFQPAGPVPPALNRAWGGLIDVNRDCAVCQCFAKVPTAAIWWSGKAKGTAV